MGFGAWWHWVLIALIVLVVFVAARFALARSERRLGRR